MWFSTKRNSYVWNWSLIPSNDNSNPLSGSPLWNNNNEADEDKEYIVKEISHQTKITGIFLIYFFIIFFTDNL